MESLVRSTRCVLKSMLARITPPLTRAITAAAAMAGRLICAALDLIRRRSMRDTTGSLVWRGMRDLKFGSADGLRPFRLPFTQPNGGTDADSEKLLLTGE